MNILPLAITPKKILLLGAGKVAAQKARAILASDCFLTIFARAVVDRYFDDHPVTLIEALDFDCLREFEVVVDATGDLVLGEALWKRRREFGYWLNVVDVPQWCDFYFGATLRRGTLCVSVSSGGASPTLAQLVRDKIDRFLAHSLEKLVAHLAHERNSGKLDPGSVKDRAKHAMGKVFLIGCGPNSKANLTLKALETLGLLEVALIDALVGQEILELLPPACLRIDVSKQKGRHSVSQEEINALLLNHAREGLVVGRLKGGDPMIFGRAGEEASFLTQHGIEVELISGISSALNGVLTSGIPPTLRGISAGMLIVSAHLRESRFHDEWISYLKDSPYTVIVLMAHSFAKEIVESAKKADVDLALPAAFVSRIDTPEQLTLLGTLGELESMAKTCKKPAILILGKTPTYAVCMPFQGRRKIFPSFHAISLLKKAKKGV